MNNVNFTTIRTIEIHQIQVFIGFIPVFIGFYQNLEQNLVHPQHAGLTTIQPGQVILWMDKILHHLRNPGMMIPCKYQPTMVSHGVQVAQDFVHPQ